MFYVFEQLPELPRLDFRNAPSVSQDTFNKLNAILQSRIELQKFVNNSSKSTVQDAQKMNEKLGFSIDLLELCEKEQIVPEGLTYKGFLKNTGKNLRLYFNPEPVFVCDLIYSRYAFSMATLKSAKAECENIRKVIHQLDVYNEVIKSIIDKLLLANTRVYRLHKFQQLVFSGLGSNSKLFELNHKTAQAMDNLFRINLSSILLIKTLSSPLNPDKAVFLAQLCKRSHMNCIESKEFWEAANAPQFQSIVDFLDIAANFYFFMSMFAVIRCNQYENDGLLKKNKDYKTIVWENKMLSDEIRNMLKQIREAKYKSGDQFNIDENKRIFQVFYDTFMATLTTECIKNFEYLQDQLGGVTQNGPKNAVNTIALTNDFIEQILSQQ